MQSVTAERCVYGKISTRSSPNRPGKNPKGCVIRDFATQPVGRQVQPMNSPINGTAQYGMACLAGQGMVWQGKAWPGKERQGMPFNRTWCVVGLNMSYLT